MTYPGGKGKCYQRLINMMPKHRVFIESHLGSGAVMRSKRAAEHSIGIDIDPRVIAKWRADPTASCDLVCDDATRFLESFTFTGDELVYADPPYMPSTRRRKKVYRCDYDEGDHDRLLRTLVNLRCMVMISGYESALYNCALGSWRRSSFTANTHSGPRKEFVWMNFDPAIELHDGSYLGNDFRERQSIKRRHERIERKFSALDACERKELLRKLNLRFGDAGGGI